MEFKRNNLRKSLDKNAEKLKSNLNQHRNNDFKNASSMVKKFKNMIVLSALSLIHL